MLSQELTEMVGRIVVMEQEVAAMSFRTRMALLSSLVQNTIAERLRKKFWNMEIKSFFFLISNGRFS